MAPTSGQPTCAWRASSVVLDVAAGTGDFTRELTRQGHRAVAY